VIGNETTLVFDTQTPPFDLLKPEALDNVRQGKTRPAPKK
jgi:hypothetical protein